MAGRLGLSLAESKQRRSRVDGSDWSLAKRRIIANLHPDQREFVLDESKRKAALVGRGGGKTTGVRAALIMALLSIPKAKLLYIATTRSQAEELMWAPLKDLIEEHGIVARFNETKLKLTLAKNGAQLILAGADNKREIEKYRGQPFHAVAIDEAASYPTKLLEHLLYRVIGPRLGDYDGSLTLIGTPGHIQGEHPFFQITVPGSEVGRPWKDRENPDYAEADRWWSTHRWTVKDGADAGVQAMQSLYRNALIEKERNGWSDMHPVWRREYLGEWALDDTENVYKYRAIDQETGEEWNQWTPTDYHAPYRVAKLPQFHDNHLLLNRNQREREWRYVVGLDLGHSDPFACQVFAYSPTDRTLWHVFEFESKEMYAKSIAQLLIGEALDHGSMGGLFGVIGWPDAIVADTTHLGGMVLDELANVYGITVTKADQKHKHDSIELFNGDLIERRIRVMKGSKLAEQLTHLQWVIDDYGRLKEDKAAANHSTDAAIYARRCALHLFAEDPPTPPPASTPANIAAELDRQARAEEHAAAFPPDNEFGEFIEGPTDFGSYF